MGWCQLKGTYLFSEPVEKGSRGRCQSERRGAEEFAQGMGESIRDNFHRGTFQVCPDGRAQAKEDDRYTVDPS